MAKEAYEGIIEVQYHPAIKKVLFKDENGNDFDCEPLRTFSQSKFLMQDHGDDFLEAIASALDGRKKIHVDFRGSDIDYGDFVLMVDYYNDRY